MHKSAEYLGKPLKSKNWIQPEKIAEYLSRLSVRRIDVKEIDEMLKNT